MELFYEKKVSNYFHITLTRNVLIAFEAHDCIYKSGNRFSWLQWVSNQYLKKFPFSELCDEIIMAIKSFVFCKYIFDDLPM